MMLGTFVAYIITRVFMPFALKVFGSLEWTKENFMGRKIPAGTGILLIPLSVAVPFVWYDSILPSVIFFYGSALIIMGFVGLYDDIFGDTKIKGLKGHFKNLVFKGRVTSGIIKAFAGVIIALAGAFLLAVKPVEIMVAFLIILLFTNAFNLFDLRPGRCIKVFFLTAIFLIIMAYYLGKNNILLLYPLLGCILAYAPFDFKGRSMLGDAGSNTIGISVGIISVLVLPFLINIILVLVLIMLHWYTEKNSLNSIIESNHFLNRIDNWGRS
ncbi:MAG: UDP-N-acetylmuramyl pentapeptide phosphotransferase [Clostridia bacterium]|nr:UDP-N-acetylmuramyl pentapeptide phosphotransferase [Clostridia bacterium]